MKNKVYLAGAISGLSYDEVFIWRDDMKSRIEELSGKTWVCFNPVEHFHESYSSTVDEFEAMKVDLWNLEHSTVMICDMNRQASLGTSTELGYAYSKGIPVIGFCDPKNIGTLHPWWYHIPIKICESEDDALLYFIEHFMNED